MLATNSNEDNMTTQASSWIIPVYTVSLGRTREVLSGASIDSTGNIEFGEYRGKPEDMFDEPKYSGQVGASNGLYVGQHCLTTVRVASPVNHKSNPGAMVFFTSPDNWLLNFRQRKDIQKFWKPWKDIEDSGKSPLEKRAAKEILRKAFPDNLAINEAGVQMLLPEPIAPNQTVEDFLSAMTKFDEGAEIEVIIYSNDRGANALIVKCIGNKIELIDPRKLSQKKVKQVQKKFN